MKRSAGKIKILVIDDNKLDGVSWWRNSTPFAALEKMYGDKVEVQNATDTIDIRQLKRADVVVRFRPTSTESLNFLNICKEFDVKLILDIDDDLWNVPIGHPGYLEYKEFQTRLRQVYNLADTIWTSTDQLRYVVGDLGRSEVMPNAVLIEDLPEQPMKWQNLAAWRGNDKQFADIMSDEAKAVYLKNRDRYRWIFAGYAPDLPHADNVRFQMGMPPLMYFLSLKRGLANIIWKPLKENLFNDSKSNIAFIEAAMSGGVCVTNYAGKPGWEAALPDFVGESEARKAFFQSRDYILETCNLRAVTRRRFESIVKTLEK